MPRTHLLARPASVVTIGAALATLAKFWIATSTYGTNDVYYWTAFAAGVEKAGPIGVYHLHFPVVYNHAPLAGWMLVVINWLQGLGFGFDGLIRIPASSADFVTALVIYRLVALRRSPREAATVALCVVWSPVLLVISGYHGNTDPVFVMFCILAVYLLAARDQPFGAGVSVGLALSIKLVPVVVLPWLVFVALRRGRRDLLHFVLGGGLVFLVLWVPVLLKEWPGFRDHVLMYRGIPLREWGISQVLTLVGLPGVRDALAGQASLLVLLAASLVPFLLLLREPSDRSAVAGLGLALATFLALSPAFGMQYISWGLAACYLFAPRLAHVFNVMASIFVVSVYSRWNMGPPWRWDRGFALPFDPTEQLLMFATWLTLVVTIVVGVVRADRPGAPETSTDDREVPEHARR